jgi:transcriptional regulator with XRE-family HTH domain
MPATPAAPASGTDATAFRHTHLATVMRLRRLSDARLAEECGLTRSSIHRYRAGKVTPSLDAAARIAKALGLPLTDLVQVPQ